MIEVKNLYSSYKVNSKEFFKKNIIKAVEDVSLSIPKNHTLGLVGESGCGKSSLGRTILRLQPFESGNILYKDKDLTLLSQRQLLPLRKDLQIIFQDPYSSLNPRLTIFEIITEGLFVHKKAEKKEALELSIQMLEKMSLKPDILNRYPHEFSGGQRQRIAIARALILNPEFIVCDEIVSALDVSNQAQVINLLSDYKKDKNLSLLFISHDLNVITHISDDIAIMYLGKIVEMGSKKEIIEKPSHPYTKSLFASTFELSNRKKKRIILSGEIPGVLNKPSGCYFHTRCPIAQDICKKEIPPSKKLSPTHFSSCHFS
ncbi:MAG TPA: ABC transporter ATP-binding protein [Leptospiraceae bacterium]|nr:ABC transporter ATP-binding protein [Leptospiraceae bacterium]HMW04581.1 ABC transporter ATP-binding protein [Leptospiraceae bacterium]HMX33266.1 ABC transporter ATP-binding protein [Leptospiraceae bacterium]HMY30767.1 ABC transporter ATP-binding protein [Leptospiraceae bacterium]HMZ66737.1 ABC transporter ATP-binding protein [Leptospiraceae bacterium]